MSCAHLSSYSRMEILLSEFYKIDTNLFVPLIYFSFTTLENEMLQGCIICWKRFSVRSILCAIFMPPQNLYSFFQRKLHLFV
jgi:hypothetical protein